MMENCGFKKICLEDSTEVRLYTVLKQDTLELILLQNGSAWKSLVERQDLINFAKQHSVNLEEYCKRFFSYINNLESDTIFSKSQKNFTMSRLLESSLKVKFFSCKLKEVDYVGHVEQLIDKFYSESVQNFERLQAMNEEKQEIEKNKISCESKLVELVERKKADEAEQLGQFLLLLNEKKRRIQHLTELLDAFNGGRPTTNIPVITKGRQKRGKRGAKVTKKEVLSESEDGDVPQTPKEEISDSLESTEEVTTDDETSSIGTKARTQNNTLSSVVAETFDFLQDDKDSYDLPKRIKLEDKSSETIVAAPSVSSVAITKAEDKKSVKARSKSPTVELNTQQLLDML